MTSNSSPAQANAGAVAGRPLQETPSRPVSLNSTHVTLNWMVTSRESVGATVAMGVDKQGRSVVPSSKANEHMLSKGHPAGEVPTTSATAQDVPQLAEVKVVGPNVASVIQPVQVP